MTTSFHALRTPSPSPHLHLYPRIRLPPVPSQHQAWWQSIGSRLRYASPACDRAPQARNSPCHKHSVRPRKVGPSTTSFLWETHPLREVMMTSLRHYLRIPTARQRHHVPKLQLTSIRLHPQSDQRRTSTVMASRRHASSRSNSQPRASWRAPGQVGAPSFRHARCARRPVPRGWLLEARSWMGTCSPPPPPCRPTCRACP